MKYKSFSLVFCLGILVGIICYHFIANPLISIAKIEGNCMYPLYRDGDTILVARIPWREGSIVLADHKIEGLEVKRIAKINNILWLKDDTGNPPALLVKDSKILGVVLIKLH
jgi:hypothetical protein